MYSLSLPSAELRRVVVVVVEDRRDAGLERRVVGDLDDDVAVDARLAVVVPREDGVERARGAEVDLHPLGRRPELDEVPVTAGLLAVGDHVELSDDRLRVARGHRLLRRQQDGALRHVERRARLARDLLEVGAAEVGGRADEHGLGELQLQLLLAGSGLRAERCQGQGEQQRACECALGHRDPHEYEAGSSVGACRAAGEGAQGHDRARTRSYTGGMRRSRHARSCRYNHAWAFGEAKSLSAIGHAQVPQPAADRSGRLRAADPRGIAHHTLDPSASQALVGRERLADCR